MGVFGFSENYYLIIGGFEEDLEFYDWVLIYFDKVREFNEKFNDYCFLVERIKFNKEMREVIYYFCDGLMI